MMSRTARLSFGIAAFLLASPALANEGGLPQLDPTWFASQVFWLLVHFVLLYLIASNLILPRIGALLDQREKRIAGDLEQAEQMQKEATLARKSYEEALQGARGKAQEAREAAKLAAQAERAAAEQKLATDLAGKTAAANEKIAQASAAMQARMREVAAEAALAIVQKVAGVPVDAVTIDTAMSRILDQRLKEVA